MRAYRVIGAMMVILLVLAACGSGDSDQDDVAHSADPAAPRSGEFTEDAPDEAADADSGASFENSAAAVAQQTNRRVIRTAELDLEVNDLERSIRHVRDTTTDVGGYVASSTTRSWNDQEAAELSIEVPSDRFDSVVSTLRDGPYVEVVQRESTSSEDVTEEFVDLQSRARNLEATEQRFITLLDTAQSLDEIMNVERELSRIRGEIEMVQGRINYLDQRTSFSRIYVSLIPVEAGTTVATAGFTPFETAREAWDLSMEFVTTIANAAIVVLVFFWWLWPLMGTAAILLLRYRRRKTGLTAAGATPQT